MEFADYSRAFWEDIDFLSTREKKEIEIEFKIHEIADIPQVEHKKYCEFRRINPYWVKTAQKEEHINWLEN